MNGFSRVLMAYTKQKSDCVPIYCGSVSSRVASHYLGHEAYVGGGIQRWREARALYEGPDAHAEYLERSRADALAWAEVCDFDFVSPTYWRYAIKPSEIIDDNTFRFVRDDGTEYVMRYIPSSEIFDCVYDSKPALDDPDDLEPQVEAMEKKAANYVPQLDFSDYHAAMAHFDYQRAAYVGGLSLAIPNTSQLWYEAVVLRPDLVERYLEAQLTVALKNIPVIAASGARFVFGGGDCANNRGLNYSPRIFRELLVPRFRKISDECKKYGIFHTFGSDGRFWDVADDLYIDAGIDGHYEHDVASEMSIRAVREKYPHITCIGGVSAATLDSKPKEAIIAEVTAAMTAAKELGGAIIGCSNLISPSTPIENVDLLLELLHKMR
jgi:uroporphyrinogen decarboxylase